MDVLGGPTLCIAPPQDGHGHGHGRMFVRQNSGLENRAAEGASSDSSSSIGAPDDSEDDSQEENADGNEVQSVFNGGGLGSLGSFGSLEESLPIKRGLSNHFSGKSKSFASLSEVSTVKEVEKRDNPFNKRRRVLIASKWSRKSSSSSSLYNWPNPKSMPLLTLNEGENEDESEDHHQEEEQESDQSSSDENEKLMRRAPNKKFLDRGLKSFKSQSCYCLSDLQGQ